MNIAGMVRRIDELGRVVIPKEIRRTLRIKEGEEMTVSLLDEDTVVMRKFSPLRVYTDRARDYRAIIEKTISREVIILDKDSVISAKDKALLVKKPTEAMLNALVERKAVYITAGIVSGAQAHDYYLMPIVLGGDVLGGVVVQADAKLDDRTIGYLAGMVELITINIE